MHHTSALRRAKTPSYRPRLNRLCALLTLVCVAPAYAGATLYSFGTAAGDTALTQCDDCFQNVSFLGKGPAGSSLSLPFYAKSYTDLFVANNGAISFVSGLGAYTGQAFPTIGLPPMIAPYWADVDTRATGGGTVWYRTTQDAAFLKTISTDIGSSFLGTGTFNATFAQVVTWDHVGYYNFHTDKLNTFQAIVASDGMRTYTMFKYPDGGINWDRGDVSPAGSFAQVGFDAGDGVNFYNGVGTRTAQMRNLPNITNTTPANPGTQIYRIDQNTITASPTFLPPGTIPPGTTLQPLPTHSFVGGTTNQWSVNGTNWTALSGGRTSQTTTWLNGDSAIFDSIARTVTVSGTIAAQRVSVNTSGYTFTASSPLNSLQLSQLDLPTADTTVNFGGSMVVLTHRDDAGLVSESGGPFIQRGVLTKGHLVFTDNSVLVARDAGMVNGADLHLQKAAQVQIYTADATTRASTLTFDKSQGGVGNVGGTLDLRGLNTTFGAVRSIGTGAGVITNTGPTGARLTIDFDSVGNSFSGVIRDGALPGATVALTKAGSGKLELTGTNTYTGGTTIQAGEIKLNGSAANSAFTVQAGAALSGSGRVGALTVAGTLAPGNSPGTLNAGATTFAGGGNYLWEINDATGLAGIGYDLLSITGGLTINATPSNRFTLTLKSLGADNSAGAVANFNAQQNYHYTLATASGGITGFSSDLFTIDASGFSNALQGGSWSVAASGNELALNFTAVAAPVPEPRADLMLLAGLLGVGFMARKRRTKASA